MSQGLGRYWVRNRVPVEERFWRYVEKTDGCWLWVGGSRNTKGYGQIQLGGKGSKYILAHRLSYQIHHGAIPDGMVVMHSCDNPSCVNPSHLRVGTQSENIKEAFAKGRKTATPPHRFGENHGASKLTDDIVREIRDTPIKGNTSLKLGEKYGVHPATIRKI